MAQLNDTLVNGDLRVNGKIYGIITSADSATNASHLGSTAASDFALKNGNYSSNGLIAKSASTAATANAAKWTEKSDDRTYRVAFSEDAQFYYSKQFNYNAGTQTLCAKNISSVNITATTFSGNLSGSAASALTSKSALSAGYATSAGAAPVASHTIASHSDAGNIFSGNWARSAVSAKYGDWHEKSDNREYRVAFSLDKEFDYDTAFNFNPNSNVLTVPTVSGNVSGTSYYANHLKALSYGTDGSTHYYKLCTVAHDSSGGFGTPVTFIFGTRDSSDNNGEGILVVKNQNYTVATPEDGIYLLTNKALNAEFKTKHTTSAIDVYVKLGGWSNIAYSLLNKMYYINYTHYGTEITQADYDAVQTTVPVYTYSLTNHNHAYQLSAGTNPFNISAGIQLSAGSNISITSAGTKSIGISARDTTYSTANFITANKTVGVSSNNTNVGTVNLSAISFSAGSNVTFGTAANNIITITAKDTTYSTLNTINSTEYKALTSTSANSRDPNAHQLSSHTNFSTYFDGTSANSALTSKSALTAGHALTAGQAYSATWTVAADSNIDRPIGLANANHSAEWATGGQWKHDTAYDKVLTFNASSNTLKSPNISGTNITAATTVRGTNLSGTNISGASKTASIDNLINSAARAIPTVNNKTITITTGASPATASFTTNTAQDKTITLGSMALKSSGDYIPNSYSSSTASTFSGKAVSAVSAVNAQKLYVTEHSTNNTIYYPVWANGAGNSIRDIFTTTAKLQFNPASGLLYISNIVKVGGCSMTWNASTSALDFNF